MINPLHKIQTNEATTYEGSGLIQAYLRDHPDDMAPLYAALRGLVWKLTVMPNPNLAYVHNWIKIIRQTAGQIRERHPVTALQLKVLEDMLEMTRENAVSVW